MCIGRLRRVVWLMTACLGVSSAGAPVALGAQGSALLASQVDEARKAAMAQRWTTQSVARAKASAEIVMSDERSSLSKYDAIVGPVKEDA